MEECENPSQDSAFWGVGVWLLGKICRGGGGETDFPRKTGE